jgi:dTDP-4-dehydrorhamnose 3,5-epimerase
MEFLRLKIDDVILITPKVFGDDRGFFLETFREDLFSTNGIQYQFVQENHSGSHQGVLRGLHYQIHHTQGKIVRALRGEIFDVAVDIRKSSATFGRWVGAFLSDQNKQQLWIPPGFAHGFYTLSDWAEIAYKATDYYDPASERTILWNDPDINVDWPFYPGNFPLVSEKDKMAKYFKEAEVFD